MIQRLRWDRDREVGWSTAVSLGTISVLAGSEIEVAGVDKDGGEHFVKALKSAASI